MFIKELQLYVDYWSDLLTETGGSLDTKRQAYIQNFYENLRSGIAYYRDLTDHANQEVAVLKSKIKDSLDDAEARLRRVLRNDPGMGVIRHADAGYDIALDTLRNNDLDFKQRLK